ncbi:ExbD/TolR family protein [Sulfuriferula nivalis]|uniref:Biopolymer transporter ExbD n=1 Tax=Sulfuriferula nivalis TaxID=2675298 RepID=A0A809S4A3_9PROT|nr:biopolymer transporter ExbD [Sulfuriferula nivalis]BBP01748.1 biopolymer transporter ExbD [Sulfuriferula nivalis]
MRYFEVRKPRIEIIPMIDIMLFLLVFFIMMAMNMIPTSGLIGHLPSSSTSQALPPPKIMIEIHQDGGLVVDQQAMSLEGLRAKLRATATDKTIVSIAGSASASLQQLTAVMDICHQNGINKIGLATQNVQ